MESRRRCPNRAALAEFEKARIAERVQAGLARARAQGTQLGRPCVDVPRERLATVDGMPVAAAAAQLGVSRSTLKRWRRRAVQERDTSNVSSPTTV